MSRGPRIQGPPLLMELEADEAKYRGEIAPGVHIFGSDRPMGRIRAYSSAGLQPFGGRGAPNEFHLLGHIHLTPDGAKVTRVEGFNGAEGEKWAKQAHEKLAKKDALTDDAKLTLFTPLRNCSHTGVR